MWTKNHKNPFHKDPFHKNPWKTANLQTRQRLQLRLDKIALEGFKLSHTLIRPDSITTLPTTPLVLGSPHSGRNYPPSFLAQSGLSLNQLRQSEDCYVDRLLEPLTAFGIPLIAANFPRIYLDLNRGPDEWPPELSPSETFSEARPISPRARAGLGVVPLRIGPDTDIYPHAITGDLIQGRLDALYHPYHDDLRGLLQTAKAHNGHALLLDCHSMPGHDASGQRRADMVLGNCYGDSCHAHTLDFIETVFTDLGYETVRNHPYAGGYITSHYGKPADNVEAIQIEINKDLYLNSATLEPHAGLAKLTVNMQAAILQIKEYLKTPTALAAE